MVTCMLMFWSRRLDLLVLGVVRHLVLLGLDGRGKLRMMSFA